MSSWHAATSLTVCLLQHVNVFCHAAEPHATLWFPRGYLVLCCQSLFALMSGSCCPSFLSCCFTCCEWCLPRGQVPSHASCCLWLLLSTASIDRRLPRWNSQRYVSHDPRKVFPKEHGQVCSEESSRFDHSIRVVVFHWCRLMLDASCRLPRPGCK